MEQVSACKMMKQITKYRNKDDSRPNANPLKIQPNDNDVTSKGRKMTMERSEHSEAEWQLPPRDLLEYVII